MEKQIEKVNIHELKTGDIFSFRTIKRPIWWRFIEIKNDVLTYEEIRSKFQHQAQTKFYLFSFVLRRKTS